MKVYIVGAACFAAGIVVGIVLSLISDMVEQAANAPAP